MQFIKNSLIAFLLLLGAFINGQLFINQTLVNHNNLLQNKMHYKLNRKQKTNSYKLSNIDKCSIW